MSNVIKRNIVDKLEQWIGTENTIVLHGARQVGKTHILKYLMENLNRQGEQCYYMDLEDDRKLEIVDRNYEEFISYLEQEGLSFEQAKQNNKKIHVFIDEIQYMENPSSFIKLLSDHHKYIQLIVSGSSSFDIKRKFSDSLVGRTVEFEVFNLCFEEFLRFKNETINLKTVRNSTFHLEQTINLYKEYMFYGGYPKIVLEPALDKKETLLQQIIQTYIDKDVRDLGKITDTNKFNNLLRVLAEQSGQLLNVQTLAEVCNLSRTTVDKYLTILEQTYVIKLLRPYSTNRRVEIVKSPKIFFYDTGLMQLLWLKKLNSSVVGNIFETSVFAELVKNYGYSNLHFWRTKTNVEVDFILNKENQAILPIEVKHNFKTFKKRGLQSFMEKHKVDKYMVVGLDGEPEEGSMKYPWEI